MDRRALYELHKKYAPTEELLNLVWPHSLIVWNIAKEIINAHPELLFDRELVASACLLHDIGTYFVEPCKCHPELRKRNTEPYIKHGVIGADIVRKELLGKKMAKIIERHIGVGISKEEIITKNLPLPLKNFIPETIEEKLVAYADNFHSKKPKFNTYEEMEKQLEKYGKENVARLEEYRGLFGIPRVTKIPDYYENRT